jgi:hypothetical protein
VSVDVCQRNCPFCNKGYPRWVGRINGVYYPIDVGQQTTRCTVVPSRSLRELTARRALIFEFPDEDDADESSSLDLCDPTSSEEEEEGEADTGSGSEDFGL